MKNIINNNFIISPSAKINEAIHKINLNSLRTLIVLDKKKTIGVLTEGDLIRGFINGFYPQNSIKELIQYNFIYVTKNNIATLYDIGILGIVKHSRTPLRFMVVLGFISSVISLLIGIFYLIFKLLFWKSFVLGLAPIIIGIFIVSSIQIALLGLVGEYIGVILLHQRNLPLVIEKERINF